MNRPTLRLRRPASPRTVRFARLKRDAVSSSGSPTSALMIIIPPVEPTPKTAMYANPTSGDGTAERIKSIKAALPASP
jgi:hypothetical protein